MIASLPTLTFAAAVLSAALCLGLYGLRSRGRTIDRLVLSAFAATLVWAGAIAYASSGAALPAWWLAALEALRYAAWIVALREAASGAWAPWLRNGTLGLCISVLSLSALMPLFGIITGLPMNPARLITRGTLLMACAGLVLIEQLLRNASPDARRGVKLCALGLGAQFAYDLFLYSQAELVGELEPAAWAVRGIAVALLVPITALGFRRLAQRESGVFVSRHVVFYSSAFLAVGGYLLVMSLGGYYVRVHGGTWGESLQLLFFVGAGVVLASVLLSDSVWRRLRVFITKHFYRNKYDYRVEWLRFVRTLSATDIGDAKRAAIRAIAQIFNSPGGLVFLRSAATDGFEPKAQWSETNATFEQPPLVAATAELARFLLERNWVIDLSEYRDKPSVYRNVSMPNWLFDPRFNWHIITPLLEGERMLGFLVLQKPPPPFRMTYEDRDLLQMVGRHVAVLIAQQQADERLTESRQFDAYNRFAAFVMHDLKNAVAQLQLLVGNAVRHRHNPAFMDDAISTISNTVERMTRLIEQLQRRDVEGATRAVSLSTLIQGAGSRTAARQPAVSIRSTLKAEQVVADPERLSAVLEHVIRNAQDATGPSGVVALTASLQGANALISIADNGPGMDPEFVRTRLFRPFDSTKGAKGMGIGAYQAREYVRQLGGEVQVETGPAGTAFGILLPLHGPEGPP